MENLSWHAVPKNLTRKSIESRVDDFIYVVARKDFLDDGENLPEGGTPATVVIGKIAFEFPIHFPILLGGDVLGVMEFFSFTI